MNTYQACNAAFTKAEIVFNVCGSLPFVSVVTSPVRILAGKIQAIAALAIGVGVSIALFIEGQKNHPNPHKIQKFSQLKEYAFHHAKHGLLNIIRGVGETLVSLSGAGIFNAITFLPLNLAQEYEFTPIKKYRLPAAYAIAPV